MNASEVHKLIVESISPTDGYICKLLQDNKKSLSGVNLDIATLIPGAQPLNHLGTRIWVVSIKDSFLSEVQTGAFVDGIIESWWQVLGPRFNARINVLGKQVVFVALPSPIEEVTSHENHLIPGFGRIKRLHLAYYAEMVPPAFDGIMVQRANMMIEKLPFDVHSKDYRGKFSGFIEFDEKLEESLKEIEKNDHCGFQSEAPWKEVKQLIKGEAAKFVSKIIPAKPGTTIPLRNLSAAIQRANQIIGEHCPDLLGGGAVIPPIPPKEKRPVRIGNLYLNKRELKWGDVVKARCTILNTSSEDTKVSLEMSIKFGGSKILTEEYTLKLKAGESKRLKLTELQLDKSSYEKGKYQVRAILRQDRKDIDSKTTSFFLEDKREPIKKGFIKGFSFYDSDEPTRNREINNGIVEINLEHSDFTNVRNSFYEHPKVQNKQIGYYIIKICCDEAARAVLKARLMDDGQKDVEEIVQDIKDLQDRMYYDVIS